MFFIKKVYTFLIISVILYKVKEREEFNMNYLRKTKIVCTIGPASENRLPELIKTGMDVVRLNFSHGSYEEQKGKIDKFFEARKTAEKPVALLLDMQGPEVRTEMLENAPVKLVKGETFTLVNNDITRKR